jgi:hypothetical protein
MTEMTANNAMVVLVHGAWADGSSWAKVMMALAASGVKAVAAPLPLTHSTTTSRRSTGHSSGWRGWSCSPATLTPAGSSGRPAWRT